MLNNFIKWNTGRTNIKIIATMIVITLTFANFAILGSFITESIAMDASQNSIEINNVKFEAYLDEEDKSKNQVTADLGSEDLKLYVSIDVQNEGKLEDIKIDFTNSNFELKGKTGAYGENYNETITAGNTKTIEIPIVARKDANYKLDLLNMTSEICLTGKYIDSNNIDNTLQTSKEVTVEWTTNEITEDQINLSQELITNKIYNIEGNNKRVVQLLVKANLIDNKTPVAEEKIEMNIPSIGNAKPEQVKVIAKNTMATNGKTNIEFGEEGFSSYEYKDEEGKLYIDVLNNANSENAVAWQKNAQDEFIVTYIYAEDVEITPFISNAKVILDLYGRTENSLEKEDTLTLEQVETIGEIASFEKYTSNNIYKGYMYVGEDTTYQTKDSLFISYSDIVEGMELKELGETIEAENLATYFNTSKINKAQGLDLLGEEGTIKIYNEDNKETALQEILLSEEIEEDYIVITYGEGVSKIAIETSKPVKEGMLDVLNEKVMKVLDTSTEIEATSMKAEANLGLTSSQNAISMSRSADVELKEPVTTIDMNLNKTAISNQDGNTEDKLELTVVLKSIEAKNKLFKNPVLNIELPSEITSLELEDAVVLDAENEELQIKTKEIKTKDDGSRYIEIILEGEQTKYSENTLTGGPNIIIYLKDIKANNFMANKNVELKATCINDGENVEATSNLTITSKQGFVTKNSLEVDGESKEQINKNNLSATIKENSEIRINSQIINNFGKDITNFVVTIFAPEGLSLTGEQVNQENVAQGQTVEATYELTAPEDISNLPEELEAILTINYTVNGEQKEEKITYTFSRTEQVSGEEEQPQEYEKVNVSVETIEGNKKLGKNDSVKNGQVLKYIVKVENKSQEIINNAKVNINIENAVFYDLVEDGVIEDESVDENGNALYPEGRTVYSYDEVPELTSKELTIGTIAQGRTRTVEYMIVAYKGTNNILKNDISIIADEIEKIDETYERIIEDGALSLKLEYGYSEGAIAYSNSDLDIFLETKNISGKNLENVDIAIDMPNGIDCNIDDQISINYTDGVSISKKDNTIHVIFEEIPKDEIEAIKVTLITGRLSYDTVKGSITLVATATIDGDENTYVSNNYTINFLQAQAKLSASFSSNKNGETLNNGDEIIYTLVLNNEGTVDVNSLNIFGESEGIEFISEQILDSAGNVYTTNNYEEPIEVWSTSVDIRAQDTITIQLKAKVNLKGSNLEEVKNKLNIDSWQVDSIETEVLANRVVNPNPVDPDPDPDPDPTPPDPGKYSISGLAWLDTNKNGVRENSEEILKGIKVYLLDVKGNIVLDENNEEIYTQTSLLGTYKFSDLDEGEYVVAFEYDNTKYTVAKYQASDASETNNSDVIAKQITLKEKQVNMAVTDTIKLSGTDVNNIDLGLVELGVFDLRLDKYISKVIVTNGNGTTTYDFGEEKLAKVEISAKQLAKSTIIVEYELVITNEGDVTGYVTNLADYLPSELEFNSELNTEWYVTSNGILNNLQLEPRGIEPGKTQTVKLVLTKSLNSNSTGTITNTAEIAESSNLENLIEKDSIAGDKLAGQDDISEASLIVSISTGGPQLYIGIVILSLAVIGAGIYLINKKVIKA